MATLQEILNQQNQGLVKPLPTVNPILSGYQTNATGVVTPYKAPPKPAVNSYLTITGEKPAVKPAGTPWALPGQTNTGQTTTPTPVIPNPINPTTNTQRTAGTTTGGGQVNIGTATAPMFVPSGSAAHTNYLANIQNAAPITPTVPGSLANEIVKGAGFTYTQSPQELAEDARIAEARKYTESSFDIDTNPDTIYQNKLKEFQAQIDSINNVYADQLAQARVQGQGRIESRQFAQGRAGQIGSGTGEAGINAVEEANFEIEKALINEQNNKIQEILTGVRKGAAEDLAAKTKAKKEGADAILANNLSAKEERKKRLTNVVSKMISGGFKIEDMSPEQIKEITDKLGVNESDIKALYTEQKTEKDLAATKASQEEEKRQLDLKKTEADISKINSDVANWGKMTDYQKQQIAVDWYKAKNPTIPASDTKVNNLVEFSNALSQSLDQNSKLTPAQYNAFKSQYIAADIGNAKDFDSNYAQHVYINKKDKEFGYTGADYGLKEEK